MADSNVPPSDTDLLAQIQVLHQKEPNLGAEKVHKQLLVDNPSWVGKVGLKRVKQIRTSHGLVSLAPGAPGSDDVPPPQYQRHAGSNLRMTPGALQSGGGQHGKAKSASELLDIERRLNDRMSNVSKAFIGQNNMHTAARDSGKPCGGGWYAVLPDGQDEYEYEKVLWVYAASEASKGGDPQAIHAAITMLERGKAEALLRNPAGVYLIFKSVFEAVRRLDVVKQKEVTVSERSFARQLQNEYGIDVLPFKREAERNPNSKAGKQLMELVMSMMA